MPRASWEFIGSVLVLLPSELEQLEIVEHLRVELHKISELYKAVSIAITQLKEYRTALITATVTGKIDVRDFNPEKLEGE
jgi:type I restriction enzyme S subunit